MAQRVLVVDDEQNIVDILRFNLEREGYEVITAADGVQGLEMARSSDPPPGAFFASSSAG